MTEHHAEEPGRFAFQGIDGVLLSRARLGIMTALITRPEGLLFTELKELCSLTDGNLSRHLDALHKEHLIEIRKDFDKKRPQTTCKLTPVGRQRFHDYLTQLEKVIHDALEQEQAHQPAPSPDSPRTGFAST